MGPFASAVTIGCLDAMRWLLWLAAVLLAALIVVQNLRGDEAAQPAKFAALATGAFALGWICILVSRRLAARRP